MTGEGVTSGGRKLQAQESNPDAPDKKKGRSGQDESASTELAVAEGPPTWWKQAMKMEREELAKATEAAVGRAMLNLNAEVAELREEVKEVRQQAERSAVTASEAQEQVRALKVEMHKLKEGKQEESKDKPPDRRKDVRPTRVKEGKETSANESSEDEEDGKELEMVFAGFKFNTPSADIKDYIDVIMKSVQPAVIPKAIRTTRKMTSFVIVKFTSIKDKTRFKRWLATLKEPLAKDGTRLRIGDNDEKEVRTRGRAIAKVARALFEAKEGRKDVTADYPNLEVYVRKPDGSKQKRVAYFEDGSLKLKGEAWELKDRIQALIDEKRRMDDDSEYPPLCM